MVAHPIMLAEGRKGPVGVGPIKIFGHPGASCGRASRPIHFRRVGPGAGRAGRGEGAAGPRPTGGVPGQGPEPGSTAVTSNTPPQTWKERAEVFMERYESGG